MKAGQLSRIDILDELNNGDLKIFRGWEGASFKETGSSMHDVPPTESRERHYIERHIQKASFDISPSLVALSAKLGMLETVYCQKSENTNRYYVYVRPGDTVLIVSNEFVECPNYMAGYVTSRVSNVFSGFGHISTTIDPGWKGAPLIALSNPTNKPLKIYVGTASMETLDGSEYKFDESKALATLTFHYLNTPYSEVADGGIIKPEPMQYRNMRVDLLLTKKYPAFLYSHNLMTAIRYICHPKRRAFTDYFFEYIKAHEPELSTEDGWRDFLKEFGSAERKTKLSSKEDVKRTNPIQERKERKHVRSFVVEENWKNRLKFFLARHRISSIIVALFIVLLLQTGITYFSGIHQFDADNPTFFSALLKVILGFLNKLGSRLLQ